MVCIVFLSITYYVIQGLSYSEVPNRRADQNKQAGLEENAPLLAYLLSKSINEQGGTFHLLHEKLRAGWNENLKNLSEHTLLLGTSEYSSRVNISKSLVTQRMMQC